MIRESAPCMVCGCRDWRIAVNSSEQVRFKCWDCGAVGGYGWDTNLRNVAASGADEP